MKIPLRIDYRERNSGIPDLMRYYPGLFTIKICTLQHGDYEIHHDILIERKTLTDFIQSLKTGRLFKQAYSAIKCSKCYLLLLEGEDKMLKHKGITDEAIQGALLHLSVFAGVSVLRTANAKETAQLIFYLGRQLLRNHTINHKSLPQIYKPLQNNRRYNTPVAMLTCIPGIGCYRAQRLMQHYGSLKNIALANTTSLSSLKGIGNQLALSVYEFFNSTFNKTI